MAIDDYEILSFDQVNGSLQVYFASIDFKWSIDVPIDGTAKDPIALDGYIRGFFPRDMYQRKHNQMDPEAANYISSLVKEPNDQEKLASEIQPTISRIYNALRQSDWTQLLDSGLDPAEVQNWATYRSDLRTLLNNISKEEFNNLKWPTAPDNNLVEIKVNVW